MISVSSISKSFGEVKALDNLSFKVSNGEIIGLLGPNGAGKTTTMRIMTGFLSPDKGKVEINNIDIAANPLDAQKQIGYMPENNPLYKEMLVSEFLSFSGELRNLSKEEIKKGVDFAVSVANIADVYYRPIRELSKGYKQRVGMAAVLMHEPKVLILDEPTEGLDPIQRAEVRTLIKKLAKGHTVVISTHVMQEVKAVCSRLIIINKGKLIADGTAKELTQKSGEAGGILVVIEGERVVSEIKKLKEIRSCRILKSSPKKTEIMLYAKEKSSIQPSLMKLAVKNNWVIWKLSEEERSLEDVFQRITRNM